MCGCICARVCVVICVASVNVYELWFMLGLRMCECECGCARMCERECGCARMCYGLCCLCMSVCACGIAYLTREGNDRGGLEGLQRHTIRARNLFETNTTLKIGVL